MLLEKKDGSYKETTYKEVQVIVRRLAAGLISMGLKKGDRVCLFSEGRNNWIISEIAVLYTGAVNVPLSVKIDEILDLEFRIRHSDCCMAVVSGMQLEKIRKIKNNLPGLTKIIVLDEIKEPEDDEILIRDVIEKGIKLLSSSPEMLGKILERVEENDYANICYTSGTISDPKGILLTHRNYTANVEQSSDIVGVYETDRTLLILPWDHAFAHTCGIYTLIKNGGSIASVQSGRTPLESLKNIALNIKETRPTVLLSVPALAKSLRKNIEKSVNEKGRFAGFLFRIALYTAYAFNSDGYGKGKGWRFILMPLCRIFDRLVFTKIRDNLGGRLRFFIGGGALLDANLQRFFYALGIPMFQGYGLTEAAPVISANTVKRHKIGSSGCPVGGLEIIIRDENDKSLPAGEKGEITVKGENVMAGYWKNDQATAIALRKGWLYTGDIGYIDRSGFLYVLGRTKSLLIGNDGEKFSPEGIEEALTENSRFISQVMLYNDQCPCTVALVVPDRAAVGAWISARCISLRTAPGQDSVLMLIDNEIKRIKESEIRKKAFPGRWFPSAVAVISEEFSEDNGLINSTMKMVRNRIAGVYKDTIRFLYTEDARNICNDINRKSVIKMERSSS